MKHRLLEPCCKVQIGGKEYVINTDFSVWIEIEHLFFDKTQGDAQKLAQIFTLAYPVLPEDPVEAVRKILWFYSGGLEKESEAAEMRLPSYDLNEDFELVWGAFKAEFGIDLTEETMHWWKFRALLGCLGDDCRFVKVVGYRNMDTSAIKDKNLRRFYEKMKKQYRLSMISDEKTQEQILVDSLGELF